MWNQPQWHVDPYANHLFGVPITSYVQPCLPVLLGHALTLPHLRKRCALKRILRVNPSQLYGILRARKWALIPRVKSILTCSPCACYICWQPHHLCFQPNQLFKLCPAPLAPSPPKRMGLTLGHEEDRWPFTGQVRQWH